MFSLKETKYLLKKTSGLLGGTIVCIISSMPSVSAYTIFDNRTNWESAIASGGGSITTENFKFNYTPISNPAWKVYQGGTQTIFPNTGIKSIGTGGSGTNNNAVLYDSYNYTNLFGSGSGGLGIDAYRFRGSIDTNNDYDANKFDTITWTFPQPVIGFFATVLDFADGDGGQLLGDFDGSQNQQVVLDFANLIQQGTLNDVSGRKEGDTYVGILGTQAFSSITWRTRPTNPLLGRPLWEDFSVDNFSFVTASSFTLPPSSPPSVATPEPLTILGSALALTFGVCFKKKVAKK